MGYESRVYIVNKSNYECLVENGKVYASVVAMFDGCKWPALRSAFHKETDCYIYGSDGSTKILKDCYGEALKEATIDEVIKAIENDKGEYYRRTAPLLGLLKGFELADWNNLVVLHCGH